MDSRIKHKSVMSIVLAIALLLLLNTPKVIAYRGIENNVSSQKISPPPPPPSTHPFFVNQNEEIPNINNDVETKNIIGQNMTFYFNDTYSVYNGNICLNQTFNLGASNALNLIYVINGNKISNLEINIGINTTDHAEVISYALISRDLQEIGKKKEVKKAYYFRHLNSQEIKGYEKTNITVSVAGQTSFNQEANITILSDTSFHIVETPFLEEKKEITLNLIPNELIVPGKMIGTAVGLTNSAFFIENHQQSNLNVTLTFVSNELSALSKEVELCLNNESTGKKVFNTNQRNLLLYSLNFSKQGLNILNISFIIKNSGNTLEISELELKLSLINDIDESGDEIDQRDIYTYVKWEEKPFSFDISLKDMLPERRKDRDNIQSLKVFITYSYKGDPLVDGLNIKIQTKMGGVMNEKQKAFIPNQQLTSFKQDLSLITFTYQFKNIEDVYISLEGQCEGKGLFFLHNDTRLEYYPPTVINQKKSQINQTLADTVFINMKVYQTKTIKLQELIEIDDLFTEQYEVSLTMNILADSVLKTVILTLDVGSNQTMTRTLNQKGLHTIDETMNLYQGYQEIVLSLLFYGQETSGLIIIENIRLSIGAINEEDGNITDTNRKINIPIYKPPYRKIIGIIALANSWLFVGGFMAIYKFRNKKYSKKTDNLENEEYELVIDFHHHVDDDDDLF